MRIALAVVRSMDSAEAIGTYANENPICTRWHHSGRAMTAGWTGSGNRGGRPYGSRNRAILNEEFIAALLRHFRREGERAIARMAATQPGAYCKILTLLVPRELKLEHRNIVADLTDEQLETMIAELDEKIARRAAGAPAKVIEGTVETTAVDTTAPPAELEPPKRKQQNRLLQHVDTAIGTKEHKAKKRNVPPGA